MVTRTTAAAVCRALAMPVAAGTFFRLEVGPPVAAGTSGLSGSLMKNKKVLFVVRPRLCDDVAGVHVSGTAEGVVNGARRSVPIQVIALSTPGVHAVQQQWAGDGEWLVHLTATCPATRAVTSALIPLKGTAFVRERIELLPQAATRPQVEAAVAALARAER
jgi:hypothetical protein